jgi:RNA polymerase sigma-70 factor (ECF subfamily)
MAEFPDTRESLLARVQRRGDDTAWREFPAIYRPVVYRLARQRGLQHADAEDLAQRVLVTINRAIGSWEAKASRGPFRHWLARITRNAILNALTRRRPDRGAGGTAILEMLGAHPQPDRQTRESLEREYRRSLFRWAARRICDEFRGATWEAFWLTTAEGIGVAEAAATLGKSRGAVYAARSRGGGGFFESPRIRWPCSSNKATRFFVPGGVQYRQSVCSQCHAEPCGRRRLLRILPVVFSQLRRLLALPGKVDWQSARWDTKAGDTSADFSKVGYRYHRRLPPRLVHKVTPLIFPAIRIAVRQYTRAKSANQSILPVY